jgi:hypothetical protein
MLWVEKYGGLMQDDKKAETSNLEDSLPMVTYIMLHRIYDLLSLIASKVADPKDVEKMIEYHEAGYLLGPVPSFNPGEENE